MRFKTFRNLAVAGGVTIVAGSIAGVVALVSTLSEGQPAPPVRPSPVASQPVRPQPATSQPAPATYDPSLRPVDRMILDFLRRPATSEKVKDAFPREPFKVNIYRDAPGS